MVVALPPGGSLGSGQSTMVRDMVGIGASVGKGNMHIVVASHRYHHDLWGQR